MHLRVCLAFFPLFFLSSLSSLSLFLSLFLPLSPSLFLFLSIYLSPLYFFAPLLPSSLSIFIFCTSLFRSVSLRGFCSHPTNYFSPPHPHFLLSAALRTRRDTTTKTRAMPPPPPLALRPSALQRALRALAVAVALGASTTVMLTLVRLRALTQRAVSTRRRLTARRRARLRARRAALAQRLSSELASMLPAVPLTRTVTAVPPTDAATQEQARRRIAAENAVQRTRNTKGKRTTDSVDGGDSSVAAALDESDQAASLSPPVVTPSLKAPHVPTASDMPSAVGATVVVLGGGVSGLTAAWALARVLVPAGGRVVLLEAAEEPGGQVRTLQAPPADGAAQGLRIETGPRSLRTTTASAVVALRVIHALGVAPLLTWANPATRGRRFVRADAHVVHSQGSAAKSKTTTTRTTSTTAASNSPAAVSNATMGSAGADTWPLEELPTALAPALAFAWRYGLPGSALRDLLRLFDTVPPEHALDTLDRDADSHADAYADPYAGAAADGDTSGHSDTIHAFFARHLSPRFATRFVSALVHGIFSGDSRQLLVRYAFPPLWRLRQAYGSIVAGALLDTRLDLAGCYADPEARETPPSDAVLDVLLGAPPADLEALVARAKKERVASLEGGLSTLITALADAARHAGVEVRLGCTAATLLPSRSGTDVVVRGGDAQDGSTALVSEGEQESKSRQATDTSSASTPTATAETKSKITASAVLSTLPPDALADLLATSNATADRSSAHTSDATNGPSSVHFSTVMSNVVTSNVADERSSAHGGPASLLPSAAATAAVLEPAHRRAQAAVAALQQVRSLSIAVVTFVYRQQRFETTAASSAAPGFGFLAPATETRGLLLGVVYDSCVFPALAGEEHLVLTAMLGGADPDCQEQVEALSETALLALARDALAVNLGVHTEPSLARLTRWVQAIPQFDATYARARATMDQYVATDAPWLFLAGKAFAGGVGVNDCIAGALHAAGDCLHALGYVGDEAVC